MNISNNLERVLRSNIWLAGGLLLLATGAHAQTQAANFGSVDLCASGQTAAACSQLAAFDLNSADSNVSVLTEGEPGLDFRLQASACVGARCRVEVAFRPLHPGLRRGMLVAKNSTGAVIQSIPLYGVGIGAQLGFGFSDQTTLTSGVKVAAMAVDGAGAVYFADAAAKTISKLQSNGTLQVVAAGFSCSALALDGGGNLYIGDETNQRLLKLTPANFESVLMTDVIVAGLATDGAADVLVADRISNSIIKIPSVGNPTTITTGSYTGVAVGAAGEIFAENSAGRVVEISPVKKVLANEIDYSEASLALDASGSVYVRNHFTLLRIAPDQTATPTSGSQPAADALDAVANPYYADNAVGRIVRVNRATATISLPSADQGSLTPAVGGFLIENTGNAPMIGLNAVFDGDDTAAHSDCETLQPGQTCLVQLNVPPSLAQGNGLVNIIYITNNQAFSTNVPVSFTQVSASTLQLTEQILTGEPTFTATIAPSSATGTVTLQNGGLSCSLPVSAGSVSCSFPAAQNDPNLQVIYSGDRTTVGQTATFAPTANKSGTTTWDLGKVSAGGTDSGIQPAPPPPGCSGTTSYDQCGGQDQ